MGFPYFNPPNIQKVNTIEEGNFFVPTQGVEEEELTREVSRKKAKVLKVLKICGIVLGVAVFALLLISFLKDPNGLAL